MEDDDIFSEMATNDIQDIFKEFQKSFGFLDLGAFMKDSFFEPPIRENPRDKMLKIPENERVMPKFGGIWNSRIKEQPELRMDSDIDDKVNELGILKFDEPSRSTPATRTFFRSVSIRTIRTADGKLEEHRTVKDSSGKVETTMKKSLGDQSIETKILHDSDGFKEKIDNYVNIDENSISDFQKRFEGQAIPFNPMLKNEPEINGPKNTFLGLFKNFFRFSDPTD